MARSPDKARRRQVVLAAVLGACLWQAPVASAAGWKSVEVYTGFDYSSGDYGETVSTDILYFPLTVKYATGPWTFRGTTSYIRIHGPANVIGVGENSTFIANLGPTGRFNRSGPGDIILGATYSLPSLWHNSLFVDLTGKVKLPTASVAKALGTGKTDFTGQIDIAKAIGRLTPFATIAYRIIGEPIAYPLHDAWNASAGLQYTLSRRISTGVAFDYRQSASPTGTDPQELFTYVNIGLGDKWSLDLYGVAGLSDGSADAAGGVQITFRPR
jgi:hypothetical protein